MVVRRPPGGNVGRPTRVQAKARQALLDSLVAIFDDDRTLTLKTDLDEAVEHLPVAQQQEARNWLVISGLNGHDVLVQDLFRTDPYSG
jgi:hypothetical protein